MNGWRRKLLAVGGDLRPDNCSYAVHTMKPTKDGDCEYVKEKSATTTKAAGAEQEELEDFWEDMNKDKLDSLDPGNTPLTVSLIDTEVVSIKRLTNNKSVENLGLQVQPGGKCVLQLKGRKKEKVEDWTGKAKTGHLPVIVVWQSSSVWGIPISWDSHLEIGTSVRCRAAPSIYILEINTSHLFSHYFLFKWCSS